MLPDGLGFTGRTHQGAADGVNAALNYGYGILMSHVWGAVMNAGLEPFAGSCTWIAAASRRWCSIWSKSSASRSWTARSSRG
jgi:hypothetical protein